MFHRHCSSSMRTYSYKTTNNGDDDNDDDVDIDTRRDRQLSDYRPHTPLIMVTSHGGGGEQAHATAGDTGSGKKTPRSSGRLQSRSLDPLDFFSNSTNVVRHTYYYYYLL